MTTSLKKWSHQRILPSGLQDVPFETAERGSARLPPRGRPRTSGAVILGDSRALRLPVHARASLLARLGVVASGVVLVLCVPPCSFSAVSTLCSRVPYPSCDLACWVCAVLIKLSLLISSPKVGLGHSGPGACITESVSLRFAKSRVRD